jgi:hypothetical protein
MGLNLRGSTSGAIDINPPAVAGDNAITLPASNGSAHQFFKNSGTAGIITYSSMVENSGKIGIGTAQPVNKFQVGIDTTSFNILSNGLVGIGTTDPNIGARLSVVVLPEPGRGAINIQNHEVGSGKTNIVMRSLDNNGGNWAGAEFRAEGYSFKIRTTERFIFGFYGELGLGLPNTAGYTGPNYGTSGQVLKSQGVGSGVTWADAATSSLSYYFYGRQDTQHNINSTTYTRVKNFGNGAINQGDSSVATWDESNGTLTIGASGAGTWFLNFGAGIDDISGGYMQVVIGKNGSATDEGTVISTYKRDINDFNNYIVDSEVTTMVTLSDGDVVSGYIYWVSGADASPQATEPNRCHFLGYKMMT